MVQRGDNSKTLLFFEAALLSAVRRHVCSTCLARVSKQVCGENFRTTGTAAFKVDAMNPLTMSITEQVGTHQQVNKVYLISSICGDPGRSGPGLKYKIFT